MLHIVLFTALFGSAVCQQLQVNQPAPVDALGSLINLFPSAQGRNPCEKACNFHYPSNMGPCQSGCNFAEMEKTGGERCSMSCSAMYPENEDKKAQCTTGCTFTDVIPIDNGGLEPTEPEKSSELEVPSILGQDPVDPNVADMNAILASTLEKTKGRMQSMLTSIFGDEDANEIGGMLDSFQNIIKDSGAPEGHLTGRIIIIRKEPMDVHGSDQNTNIYDRWMQEMMRPRHDVVAVRSEEVHHCTNFCAFRHSFGTVLLGMMTILLVCMMISICLRRRRNVMLARRMQERKLGIAVVSSPICEKKLMETYAPPSYDRCNSTTLLTHEPRSPINLAYVATEEESGSHAGKLEIKA